MSLKDWMKKVEGTQLNEFATTGQIQIKPASQMPKTPGQAAPPGANNGTQPATSTAAKPGQPATNANTQVITQGNKTLGTVNNPQLAQQIKQSIGKGEMTLAGDQLGEDEMMEVAPPGMEKTVLALKKKFPGNPGRAFATAWSMYNKKHGKTEESMMESKQLNEGSLDEIIGNHPHEHKMCQEGWGMDNSLFEALADHYFKEGRIPRSVWHGSAEGLREFVEGCYAKDTMGTNEDSINSGMLDEEGVAEGGKKDRQWSDQDMERLRRAETELDDIFGTPNDPWTKTKQRQIKQRIKTKPMAGPKGVLPEQGVAEGSEQVYNIVAVDKGNAMSKPKKLTYKAGSIEEVFDALAANDWYPLEINGVEVINGKHLKQGVAEGSKEDFTMNARQADPRLDKYATDPKRSFLDKTGSAVGGALKKAGSTVMNKLHPSDDQLRSGPLEETSELERMLRQSTKENEMFESKFTKLSKKLDKQPGITDPDALAASIGRKKLGQAEMTRRSKAARNEGLEESTGVTDFNPKSQGGTRKELLAKYAKSGSSADATAARKAGATQDELKAARTKSVAEAIEKTKTGIKHKADAGGYGRKDDEEDTDEDGKKIKKVKKDEPKKGRGRPKKTDNASGEDKKFDFSALSKTSASKAPKTDKWDKKKTTTHKIATKADREELDEGETIEKKGGRIHKGSYGTSHEAGDEGVKKVVTQRGRGRPKKDADDSGEVKNYDWSAFGAKKGVKLPAWDKKKTTTHKIATKADREEFDEGKMVDATPWWTDDKPGKDLNRKPAAKKGLTGKQSKLDINKNGKVDGGDFALLRGQKKKDAQMESWDRQLKGLLTEGLTVSTSVGNEGGNDTVSITASDADAHQLLQMLQNAGMGSGVPHHAVQASPAPTQVLPKDGQPTVGSIATTDGAPDASAQQDISGAGKSVPIMAMPRGMAFSVNADSEMPTEPGEFGTLDQEEVVSSLGSEQGSADDGGDGALAAIKKLMGQHGASEVTAQEATPPESKAPAAETETETEVEEAKTEKPDYEDSESPYHMGGEYDNVDSDEDEVKDEDESDEEESEEDEDKEKVEEGAQSCNECGLNESECSCSVNENRLFTNLLKMFEEAKPDFADIDSDGDKKKDEKSKNVKKIDEWSNSPQDQSKDEQFETDMKFMQDVISAGLNGRKSTGQATTPVLASQTNRQMSEGYNIDVAAQMRKLAGIR